MQLPENLARVPLGHPPHGATYREALEPRAARAIATLRPIPAYWEAIGPCGTRGHTLPSAAAGLPIAIEPLAGVDAGLARIDALLQQRGDACDGGARLLRRGTRGHYMIGRRQAHDVQDAERPSGAPVPSVHAASMASTSATSLASSASAAFRNGTSMLFSR